MTISERHEYEATIPEDGCDLCDEAPDAQVHQDPAEDLPEELTEAAEAAIEALDDLARALHSAGARDSDNQIIRHFASYHLADIEGNDGGAGWLASGLLADELRKLVQ